MAIEFLENDECDWCGKPVYMNGRFVYCSGCNRLETQCFCIDEAVEEKENQ